MCRILENVIVSDVLRLFRRFSVSFLTKLRVKFVIFRAGNFHFTEVLGITFYDNIIARTGKDDKFRLVWVEDVKCCRLNCRQCIGEDSIHNAQSVESVQSLVGAVDKEFALLQVRELPFESGLFRVSRTTEQGE